MAGLSDAEVFGSPRASTPAPGPMSDEDVYGWGGYVEPGTNTTGVDPDVDPRVADAVSSFVKRLVAPSPTGEDNPALASGDPRDSLPPAPVVAPIETAMGQGWRDTPSIATPEGEAAINKLGVLGSQLINPALKIINIPVAATNALMYGGAELANQVTGNPDAGRDFMAALNTLPFIQAGIPAGAIRPYAVPETRANPMMDAFDRAEAARAEQPSRPQPTSDVENNIAKVQAQIGVRPDQPPPTGTPADTAPPGVPPGTAVPTDLRLRAAIDATDTPPPGPAPGFVPPGTVPPVDRVPPGAAGPETVPYAPVAPCSGPGGARSRSTRARPPERRRGCVAGHDGSGRRAAHAGAGGIIWLGRR